MKKGSKPIIVLAVLVLLAVAGFSAISMYNYHTLPQVEVSDAPFGISWGTDKEVVLNTMASQGFQINETGKEDPYRVSYILNNYQGIEGASGYAIFTFDESLQFRELMLQFTTFNSPNNSCTEKGVDLLYRGMYKTLITQYEKMPYNYLEEYEYWKGENIFVTLFHRKPESVIILYSQHDTIAEGAEELSNGK